MIVNVCCSCLFTNIFGTTPKNVKKLKYSIFLGSCWGNSVDELDLRELLDIFTEGIGTHSNYNDVSRRNIKIKVNYALTLGITLALGGS